MPKAAWRQKIDGRWWRFVLATRGAVGKEYRKAHPQDKSGDPFDGFCHSAKRTIYICDDLPPDATELVALHEVVHARVWDLDEETVTELAESQHEATRRLRKRQRQNE